MKKSVLVLGSILAVGSAYWLLAPLFIDVEVDDEVPLTTTDTPVQHITEATPFVENTQQSTSTVTGTPGHPATGHVRVIKSTDGVVVRYEDYDGTNGPDLHVYLAKTLDAKEFVDLGEAKGNKGNINYVIPDDVNLDEYAYVLTWCKAFGVLFDYAPLH